MADPVIAFSTPKEHYMADACVVWCFDDRFYKLLKAFGKQVGFKNIDLVKIAGGAKALAAGPSPERDFVAGQIAASLKLHGTKAIILMTHRDCGAYGGSKNFTDAAAERVFQDEQLLAAKAFVASEAPGIPVKAYFADFDGLYEVF